MRRLSALLFVCSSLILAGTPQRQQFRYDGPRPRQRHRQPWHPRGRIAGADQRVGQRVGGRVSINANGQCTDFVSSNHFLLHLGAALRLYVTHSVYVAPELHYYYVRNNVDFTSPNVTRYGLNIGYTFGK